MAESWSIRDTCTFSVVSLSNSTLVWSSDGRELMQMVNPMTKLTENVSWSPAANNPSGWNIYGKKVKPGFGSVTDFAYESAELDLDSMGQTKKFKKFSIFGGTSVDKGNKPSYQAGVSINI